MNFSYRVITFTDYSSLLATNAVDLFELFHVFFTFSTDLCSIFFRKNTSRCFAFEVLERTNI